MRITPPPRTRSAFLAPLQPFSQVIALIVGITTKPLPPVSAEAGAAVAASAKTAAPSAASGVEHVDVRDRISMGSVRIELAVGGVEQPRSGHCTESVRRIPNKHFRPSILP